MIYLIGIQESGWDGLTYHQQSIIETADVVVGGERHLAFLPSDCLALKMRWPTPFRIPVAEIQYKLAQNKVIVFIVSGDPWHFGPGLLIRQAFSDHDIQTLSAPSVFSLASAKLGWLLQETKCVSLHGRALGPVLAQLSPDQHLLCLTSDAQDPVRLSKAFRNHLKPETPVMILSNLSGPLEQFWQGCLEQVTQMSSRGAQAWSDLNVFALPKGWCGLGDDTRRITTPGLADEAFYHDGQITKSAIRALTLSALAPAPDLCFWDIGAGCGSVTIEWACLSHSGVVRAIERRVDRCQLIAKNAEKYGQSDRVQIDQSDIRECLSELPVPDRIFVGGGIDDACLWIALQSRLKAGGICVANAVTLEGECHLDQMQRLYGGKLSRFHIETMDQIGRYRSWKPARPVMQWVYHKQIQS